MNRDVEGLEKTVAFLAEGLAYHDEMVSSHELALGLAKRKREEARSKLAEAKFDLWHAERKLRDAEAGKHWENKYCWCNPTPHESDPTIWEHHDRSERS